MMLRRQIVFALLLGLVAPAEAFQVTRTFRPERLLRGDTNVRVLQPIDEAAWIWSAESPDWACDASDSWAAVDTNERTVFRRFRCDFASDGSPLVFDVSADERYVLLLDGEIVSRGPHRGAPNRWYYATYSVTGLVPGRHRMEAVVWRLGNKGPIAQLSWRGGFVLKAEGRHDDGLTTGKAAWRTVRLANTRLTDKGTSGTYGVGSQCDIAGTSFLDENPSDGWQPAAVVRPPVRANPFGGRTKGWMLYPSACPDMMARRILPGRVVNCGQRLDGSWTVGPHETRELWWDLGDYYCAYPVLRLAGGKGAVVKWGWAESLYDPEGRKGNRSEWRGKAFSHLFEDTFRCDGRTDAVFTTPWWRCGRWCRLTIATADEPVSISSVVLEETHYPILFDASFSAEDPELDRIGALCRRTLEMCVHEMTFDCPYYEQQMYPGDSRVQLSLLNALTRDDRMARYVMTTFDEDRRSDGFVAMNFPTRGTQESATYTMCWILMFGDYLLWHDDAAFLKARMPGVRHALMGLANYENTKGLLENLPGWCYMDNPPAWRRPGVGYGVAPGGGRLPGTSSVENLLYLLCLQTAAAVDAALGETALAGHWRSKAERLSHVIESEFWDERRGLMSDTAEKGSYSEHAQCLAVLTQAFSPARNGAMCAALVARPDDLARATNYFAYYVLAALAKCGRADQVLERMRGWRAYLEQGGVTTFEGGIAGSRSDCHAWSSCPVYFLATTLAGVSPAEPFFRSVRIAPNPAGLGRIRATVPSPKGVIGVDLKFAPQGGVGTISLPEGLSGTYEFKGRTRTLHPGTNELE